jgi:acetylornithine deacetylase/succinyl-diaminopimelate desuccinylase-like protein
MSTAADAAAAHIDANFAAYLDRLIELSKIPSISAAPAPPAEVARSAQAVVAQMKAIGLENCRTLELEGAHPYAYGEWLKAPGKPTLLLYAHHDVQPPGRDSHWKSPPFEPTMRDGRLYGRGVVDDKAGVVAHIAAIDAWLRTAGALPCNVKFIVEGEEEIGSDHLAEFLQQHKAMLKADVIVLTDTANLEEGLPSLTTRLRGLVNMSVEVTGLDHPLHSGMWGGPVADPVMAMNKILASLTDDNGAIAIPAVMAQVTPPTAKERADAAALPYDADKFRADAGVLPGVKEVGEPGFTAYEKQWMRPSLTIIALEASPIKGSSNQIVPAARARVSVRLVSGMDPAKVAAALEAHIRKVAPWGMQVKIECETGNPAWSCSAEGPAFDAARRALEKGFGKKAAIIGCGGSIPFVGPFAEAFGGAPALLVGLEDPICNAHSENESLSVKDWQKGLRAACYLYEELAGLSGTR